MDEEIARAAARFAARFAEGLAILRYHYDPAHRLVLDHTEVPTVFRHQGIATQLAGAALEFAGRQKLVVVPVCPFVVAYLNHHPEFNALIRPHGGGQPSTTAPE